MKPASKQVVVFGGFDDIRSRHIRFLEEAAKLGELTVLLWNDDSVTRQKGALPKLAEAERWTHRARKTTGRVAAAAIAKKTLRERFGVEVLAYVKQWQRPHHDQSQWRRSGAPATARQSPSAWPSNPLPPFCTSRRP